MNALRTSIAKALLPVLLSFLALSAAAGADETADRLAAGQALRNSGQLQQAIDHFEALRRDGDATLRRAASGELGAVLLQAHRLDAAEPLLRAAYETSSGAERARHALELGNLAVARHKPQEALPFYREAETLAGGQVTLAPLSLMARINAARLAAPDAQPALLIALARDLDSAGNGLVAPTLARLRLSLGTLTTRALPPNAGSRDAAALVQIALNAFEQVRAGAVRNGDARLEIEALDGLAQLYERQGQATDALVLSRRGIARARGEEMRHADILLRLEWRQGRLLAAQGAANAEAEAARAAYQRAIDHVESIRQDIPIEYEDGRSSFRDTLEPLYLGLIDLLLKRADIASGNERTTLLLRAREVADLVRQSELQDYLGERCSVDTAPDEVKTAGVASGTAILYPVILKDRLELIFESAAGLERHAAPLDAVTLRRQVADYTTRLREGDESDSRFRADAGTLYDLLIRPFAAQLAAQGVHTLLVVPDGVLRLLPWATLHDGRQFLVERHAVVVNSTLPSTSQASAPAFDPAKGFAAILAGMAEPGPVVEKFSATLLAQRVGQPVTRAGIALKGARQGIQTRALRGLPSTVQSGDAAKRAAQLRESLALPGVKVEIDALTQVLHGAVLFDGGFTTSSLHDELAKGRYRVAHLATHGYFGSSGEQSYLMAYNDLVTMNGLQKLLQLEGVRRTPIELLTLSACETAEGDDRSPLGIAGAAIKANAKSVLGTLWPVYDNAAQQVMTRFYSALIRDGVSKAEALRRAQLALVNSRDLNHPFFWAPFVLIGNWR